MTTFEVLAVECQPRPDCPQVVRLEDGGLVVVGLADPTRPGAVTITGTLWAAALDRLDPATGWSVPDGSVRVVGEPVGSAAERLAFGVGTGEAAVRVTEDAFRAAGDAAVAA